MQYIYVTGWNEHQSYRQDRGAPPWIKIHRKLMTSHKWAHLSDAEKGHLVSIWIVAADKGGKVPADPSTLRKVCLLDDKPDIEKLIDLGLLTYDEPTAHEKDSQDDVTLTPTGCQDDVTLTPTDCQDDAPEERRGEERKTEREKKNPPPCPIEKIVDLWLRVCPYLSQPDPKGKTLRKQLTARWREDPRRQTLDWWHKLFERIDKSDFLTGRAKDFTATLIWVSGPKNMEKILNGQYDNNSSGHRHPKGPGAPGGPAAGSRDHAAAVNGAEYQRGREKIVDYN